MTISESTRKTLEKLGKAYRDESVVLALGAGVSAGSGLPSWLNALERLAERQWPGEGRATLRALIDYGYGLPAIAGILQAACESKVEFTDRLRAAIYHGFPFFRRDIDKKNRQEFVDTLKRNSTLAAVAAFCVVPDTSGHARNPSVRGVFNFNFDALFRTYVHHRYQGRIVRTIERPSAGAKPKRIPIYQMHGYLHFEPGRIGRLNKEAPDVRVFTELEYFDFFNKPNTIYNYSFLHHLRESRCIFVGLSMHDENIRRLLHYSRRERVKADRREGRSSRDAKHRSIRHFTFLQHAPLPRVDELAELALRRLGTRVIWYSEHSEIPELLGSVYGTRAQWSGVYP